MTTYLDELRWRGLLHQTAGEDVESHVATPGRVAYDGMDPTSDSLHIGNFIGIQLLRLWQKHGHKPIVLMGGGTGLIGDPSGKDAERSLQTREQVEANITGQRRIFERVLDFNPANPNAAVIVNNADWLTKLNYIEMLRDIGKHFSVNVMIQKDSVRERLHGREQGISYTEFSYMILQAYDFLHLRREMNCTVQLAGRDQYGNIVAGMDLIRREFGADEGKSFGITSPLVTRSDGKKMGKSESGAIWLTADRTSPYQFYQYWINLPDADVVQFLKYYTLKTQDEIDAIASEHEAQPHARIAHKALAADMTALMHGDDELAKVEAATTALFSGDVAGLDASMLSDVFADVPSSSHGRAELEGDGLALTELLPLTSLAKSKREAREFLGNGAVAVNGEKVPADRALQASDLLHGTTILLRRGKKNWHATKWE